METESPERHRLSLPHDLRILLVNVDRSRTSNKVEVECSADDAVFKDARSHEDVGAVRVEEEDAVRRGRGGVIPDSVHVYVVRAVHVPVH